MAVRTPQYYLALNVHLISKYSDLYCKFMASTTASNPTQSASNSTPSANNSTPSASNPTQIVFPEALVYHHFPPTNSRSSNRQFKSEALTILPLKTAEEVPKHIRLILEERRRIRGDSMENWDRVASFISFFSA